MNHAPAPIATLYQPPWWHFVANKKSLGNRGACTQKSFLCFEDALWSLCRSEELPKGSLFLLPEFYCMDVVAQIETRGWRVSYYRLDSSFRVVDEELCSRIQELQPAIVIIYHAFGTSSLSLLRHSPVATYRSSTLIIEDCAHRLVDSSQLTLLGDGHVIIDSLRKVSPFQGSRVFTSASRLQAMKSDWLVPYRYYLLLLYVCWRGVLFMAMMMGWQWMWNISEFLFSRYNDAIGTSSYCLAGPWFNRMLTELIDYSSIKKKKAVLVSEYFTLLSGCPGLLKAIPQSEWQELKCFPLILPRETGMQLINFLQSHAVDADAMFSDAPACKDVTVVMLPLPVNGSHSLIQQIAEMVLTFFNQAERSCSPEQLLPMQERTL